MRSAETLSKYVEIQLSEMDNLDEINYRETIQPKEDMFSHPQKWINNMKKEKFNIPYILKIKSLRFKGNILEIGAGSCWFSSILSRFTEVNKIYALDFSKHILTRIAPEVMDYLKANAKKIIRVRGSFYNLNLLNKKFDFVVCDETIHHADHPIKLLNQISDVLKRDGRLVCIREPIAPRLPILRSISKRKFGLHERKYGVTEIIYTLEEWRELFRKGGFQIVCYPIGVHLKNLYYARTRNSARARARNLHHSHTIFSHLHRSVYGVDSMPVAFIGKKIKF